MNKMIYLKTLKKVELGDTIDINGVIINITQDFVNNNEHLFEMTEDDLEYVECIKNYTISDTNVGQIYIIDARLKNDDLILRGVSMSVDESRFKPSTREAYDRQQLLEEAKLRYPIGTKAISALDRKYKFEVTSELQWWLDIGNDIVTGESGGTVYSNGKWAEVVEPIFTTEDGVDKFEGDGVVIVYSDFSIDSRPHGWLCAWTPNDSAKAFHSLEVAEAYIEANKPKDLDYYVSLLIQQPSPMYSKLKDRNPRLFYTQVLIEIAKDLNGEWESKFNDSCTNYCIRKSRSDYECDSFQSLNFGGIHFKSGEGVLKAIKIMGSKLDLIYGEYK